MWNSTLLKNSRLAGILQTTWSSGSQAAVHRSASGQSWHGQLHFMLCHAVSYYGCQHHVGLSAKCLQTTLDLPLLAALSSRQQATGAAYF
jgi:hypothetical protein